MIFDRFLKSIKHIRSKVKILGGIVPLKSARMARYMNANIPGVIIPETVVEKLDKAGDVEKESVAIARDIADAIRGMCDGIHFMPIKANHLVSRIIDTAGL